MVLKRAAGIAGMQQQARRVAERLHARGVPVTLVTRSPARELPPLPYPVRAIPARNGWSFAQRLFRELCRLRDEYDVVHVHGVALEMLAAVAAARVTHRPLIVKPSTAGPGTPLHAWASRPAPVRRLALHFLAPVTAWVSISEHTRADLLRLGVPPERIVPIPNGVDTAVYAPLPEPERRALRAELGLAASDLVIAAACRLAPHKRVDRLIRLFADLAHDVPEARLWIMGAGRERPTLEALAARLPSGARIRFWGGIPPDAVRRNLQAADVFALLSRWEGLSNALLEAMACGLAIVATDVSGARDALTDGETGLLVPAESDQAARHALRRLAVDERLRRRLGGAAAATARARFDLNGTVERLLALYTRVCGRAPAAD